MLPSIEKLDTSQPSERDLIAFQIAYDIWLKTQRDIEEANEHDEREDR